MGVEVALTDTAIKALKPRKIRYYKTDGRGLSAEVFPSGSIAWRYRYQLAGKTEKVTLGRYPGVSLRDARQRRDELALKVAKGKSPAAEKRTGTLAINFETTVKDFAERYYKEVILRDRKDPDHLYRYFVNEIYPFLGNRRLVDVSASDIQAIVFRKRDNGFESAAAQIRNLFKRLFDYAIACQIVPLNPANATPMRFITRARPRTRALSPPEVEKYLRTLYASNIRRQFKLSLHLILLTLVRKSELRLARWSHLDFSTNQWSIPEDLAKNGIAHTVYLSQQVRSMFEELRKLAGDSELVLPGRGSLTRPFSANAMNQALGAITFPIDPFTIHDLRRTASTILHEQGFPSDVIEKALNHTIGGIRGVYNRAAYAEQRRQMLQSWADFIDTLFSEHGQASQQRRRNEKASNQKA
jgi:integrase